MSDRFQRGVTASIVNRTDGKKREKERKWWRDEKKKKKKVAQVKVELKI